MVPDFLYNIMNIKSKVIFNASIVKIFFIHVAIYFIENNIEKYEQALKKEWNNNRLLKWWHYVCHIDKICMWIPKVWYNSVKTKIKVILTSSEVCKIKMNWKSPNTKNIKILI